MRDDWKRKLRGLPYPSVLAVIVILGLVFIVQNFFRGGLVMALGTVPLQVNNALAQAQAATIDAAVLAQLGSLFTAALIHADVMHYAFNMLYLWIFATQIVDAVGWRWMLAIFVITAIAGNVAQCALNWQSPIPILGASGAVMGFEGVYLALALRFPLRDPEVWPLAHPVPPGNLVLLAVFGAALDISGFVGARQGIAFGAHLGGLIAGMFIGSFLIGSVYQQSRRR